MGTTWTLWAKMVQTNGAPVRITSGPMSHCTAEARTRQALPSYYDLRIGRDHEPYADAAPAADYT